MWFTDPPKIVANCIADKKGTRSNFNNKANKKNVVDVTMRMHAVQKKKKKKIKKRKGKEKWGIKNENEKRKGREKK